MRYREEIKKIFIFCRVRIPRALRSFYFKKHLYKIQVLVFYISLILHHLKEFKLIIKLRSQSIKTSIFINLNFPLKSDIS